MRWNIFVNAFPLSNPYSHYESVTPYEVDEMMKMVFMFLFLLGFALHAQVADTTRNVSSIQETTQPRTSWLLYARVIRDARGSIRVDENIVPTFKLNRWLYLEPGIRIGETNAGSYMHYKVELHTKLFWHMIRLMVRMSDNIIDYGAPHYRRTNYLAVAESSWPFSRSLSATAAIGGVYSRQVNNSLEGWPSLSNGAYSSYWIYKVGIRYHVSTKGSTEVAFGSYDVFNPYLPSSPFLQASFDYHVNHNLALYSYFRYQYNQHIDQPANDFLGLGVRLQPK